MTSYYVTTTSASTGSNNWWYRSPYLSYYQPFNIYSPLKKRIFSPPKEEIQNMTDEEFDAALNNLLFGGSKQEG